MFLTKMVNDIFANITNSNQQHLSEGTQKTSSRSNYKTCKKSIKKKKSMNCSYNVDETEQMSETSNKKCITLGKSSKTHNKGTTPTKVKSGSWKRSDKSIAPFNTLSNKKHKSLRKKSPNWLKFSNSKIKKSEKLVNDSESASACRPGTLYSDVLFGAGCSNLVKIKNCIQPRFCNKSPANTSQEKLTKALFKFNGNYENETSDESENDGKQNLFPALENVKNKFHSPSPKNYTHFEKNLVFERNVSCNESVNNPTSPPKEKETYEEADVVILSNLKGLSLVEKNISYGNYLEQHFQHLKNDNVETDFAASTKDNHFLISSISKIPKWNFLSVETGSSDAFPKFLCQFDDENYLKAENMVLLGLKLALGNYAPQNKYKIN